MSGSFFFNDTATTEIYTLSLHDALPITPEVQEQMSSGEGEYGGGDLYKRLVRQMGQDGWLGIGWPTEYGGQNRSMVEQLIFTDEASVAGAPVPFLTINTVGPTLMSWGTEEQKREFLPKILRGEMHFSIGYSEPGAGTDLASLTTRAVRDRLEEHTSELQSRQYLVCRLLLEKKK